MFYIHGIINKEDEFKRLKEELKLSKLGEIDNKLNKILIEIETKNK